jgi:hypothetical protein
VAYLSPNLPAGYLVDNEQSLQIREYHPDTGERLRRPEPDLTLYSSQLQSLGTTASGAALPTLTKPVWETIELNEDLYYIAAVIYKIMDNELLGRPVTRIELLSPTNKPPGDGYLQYIEKRYAALKSGLRMVEIDYLHETHSPIKGVPSYPQQPDSFPYSIVVSDPNPSLKEGLAKIYGFHVDEPIPTVEIPLLGTDSFSVDFNAVYQLTYRTNTAYGHRVDYAELPPRFETYSAADQERIRALMTRVISHQPSIEDGS